MNYYGSEFGSGQQQEEPKVTHARGQDSGTPPPSYETAADM
uniref:Uncharacterized protein n=1 Tax=Macrostomum lignano TaxID=282301 RepID=A0A1I8I7Q0_9PLAT